MSTITDNRLALPIGDTADQRPFSLDLAASPHALAVGPCGAGKTVALRQLAASALERGFQAILIDALRGALGFRGFTDQATLVGDRDGAISALEDVVAEMTRRHDLLLARGSSTVWDLPASEGVQPILVVIDEYAGTVIDRTLPRELDEEDLFYIEAREHNARAEKIKHMVATILREARSAGIHLVIGTQRPDCRALPAEMRDCIGNVLMMVRPRMPISPVTVAMAVGHLRAEATVEAALGRAAAAETYGQAVLATEAGVTPLRVSLPTSLADGKAP